MIVAETDRLILRRLSPADAPFLLELLNDPDFLQYVGDRGVRTLEQARAYVRNGPMASYDRHGFGLLLIALKGDGTPIGICGLVKRDGLDDVDLGYALLPAFRAQGYAAEAAARMLDHARESVGLARIVAIVQPGNADSIRVLERLGLRLEGCRRLTADAPEVLFYARALDEARSGAESTGSGRMTTNSPNDATHMSTTTPSPPVRPPVRVRRTFRQQLAGSPDDVFPLLCPVREMDWVSGWAPGIVYSASGVAEQDCVFTTTEPTPSGPRDAIWVITEHDRGAHRVAMVKVVPDYVVVRLEIDVRAAGGVPQRSTADVTYTFTAIGQEGEAYVASRTEAAYEAFMREWEGELNAYLTRRDSTGERASDGEHVRHRHVGEEEGGTDVG